LNSAGIRRIQGAVGIFWWQDEKDETPLQALEREFFEELETRIVIQKNRGHRL